MNFLNPLSRTRFSNGVAKVRFIFELPNFFAKIFENLFSSASLIKNSMPQQTPVFHLGLQRYAFFHYLQIFFAPQKTKNPQKKQPQDRNMLIPTAVHQCYNFVKSKRGVFKDKNWAKVSMARLK